jgi:hypothetical protein
MSHGIPQWTNVIRLSANGFALHQAAVFRLVAACSSDRVLGPLHVSTEDNVYHMIDI